MARLIVKEDPAVEPVTAAEVRAHGQIDETGDTAYDTAQATLIEQQVTTARRRAEDWLNRALITQTLKLVLNGFTRTVEKLHVTAGGSVLLPRAPLQSVSSVTVTDSDGGDSPVTGYTTDILSEPGRIHTPDAGWPGDLAKSAGVVIEFVAGFGAAADDVPEEIKLWIAQCASWLYFHRDDAPDIDAYPIRQLEGLQVKFL